MKQVGSYIQLVLQASKVEMAAARLPKSPNLICFVHVSVYTASYQIRWELSYWSLKSVVHEQYGDHFTFLLFEILNFSFRHIHALHLCYDGDTWLGSVVKFWFQTKPHPQARKKYDSKSVPMQYTGFYPSTFLQSVNEWYRKTWSAGLFWLVIMVPMKTFFFCTW